MLRAVESTRKSRRLIIRIVAAEGDHDVCSLFLHDGDEERERFGTFGAAEYIPAAVARFVVHLQLEFRPAYRRILESRQNILAIALLDLLSAGVADRLRAGQCHHAIDVPGLRLPPFQPGLARSVPTGDRAAGPRTTEGEGISYRRSLLSVRVLLKVATAGCLLGVFHSAGRSSDLGARSVNDVVAACVGDDAPPVEWRH